MAHNPHAPQGPEGQHQDPAGNTQMFRAFVDDAPASAGRAQAAGSSGPNVGLIIGVVLAVVVVAAVAWLALG